MANSVVKLSVDDSSFNAKIKRAAQDFADFGKRVASAGVDAFGKFAKGVESAKVAFQGFNAALKANALVLVASLAVEAGQALGEMIGDWIRGANDAEDAQRQLNRELEKTSLLLKDMSDSSKFNERIARAMGATTTQILQQRKTDAEKALKLASSQAADVSRNKYATPEQIEQAQKMLKAAEDNLRKARQDLLVDMTAREYHTGEYANRGGGGRSGRTVKEPTWDDFAKVNIKTNQYLEQNLGKVLAEKEMPSVWAMAMANPDALKKELGLNAKTIDLKKDITEKDYKKLLGIKEKDDRSVVTEMQKMNSGVQGIFGGIEQMGLEIPDELKGIMSGISGMMTILTSINTILGVIEGMQTVGLLPFFSRGGVVRAAGGYEVPGNYYSGDNIPALLNAGELVLNRAQTAGLSQALEGVGSGGGGTVQAVLSGEQAYIMINRYTERIGKGELMTYKNKR